MAEITRQPIRLEMNETQALHRAVGQQYPDFAPLLASGGIVTEQLVQPFFTRYRVVEVQAHNAFPTRQIHACFSPDGQAGVLTGNLAVFNAMVKADPPPRLAYEQEAAQYLHTMDWWTTENERLGELQIASMSEVPLNEDLDVVDQALMEDLVETLADAVGPPRVTEEGPAFEMVKWLVTNQKLIRRRLRVEPTGQLLREDEVFDDMLPCPVGRVWGLVNGRYVPVG